MPQWGDLVRITSASLGRAVSRRAPPLATRHLGTALGNAILKSAARPSQYAVSTHFSTSALGMRFSSDTAEAVINVPGMGDSISEGSIARWNKKIGEFVRADEVIAVVDTDKVSVDINCPMSGVLLKVEAEEGDTIFVGDPFFTLMPTEDESAGVVGGDGEESESANDDAVEAESVKSARKDTVVPMSRMRQSIAKRLKGAQENSASLTTFNEVDLTALMSMRTDLGDAFKSAHGVKLGFMSPFILACTKALERCPDVNAAIVDQTKIEYHNYVDISVAVATPTGLMVPVVRDCQNKTFADLEKELLELAGRAREGQIKMEEMAGGTFTISNGGIYGSMMGTPLLNPPQSAILGMHTISKRPVCVNGQIVVRPMMYLALTYDHQIIDGREAVTFLKIVKELLEDPRKMLLDC